MKKLIGTLFVITILFTACAPSPETIAKQTAVAVTSTAAAWTPTVTPDLGILRLTAPREVIDLWNSWNGKYVLYAHRDAGIQKFADLNGKDLFIALIGKNVTMENIIHDAAAFRDAGGITLNFVMQNNVSSYKPQFFENPARVGFMVPSVAVELGLDVDNSVVRIEFEPAD